MLAPAPARAGKETYIVPAVEEVIARSLGVERTVVTDALAFNGIPQWDSLAHVDLMLALEAAFGVTVDEDRMIELTTVPAIRQFVAQATS